MTVHTVFAGQYLDKFTLSLEEEEEEEEDLGMICVILLGSLQRKKKKMMMMMWFWFGIREVEKAAMVASMKIRNDG